MKRQLNIRFLVGLILAVALIGASCYGLHAIQVKRSAVALLRLVNQAEAEGDRDKAIERLEHYLYYRPDDVGALIKLGTLLAPEPDDPRPGDIVRAQRTLERALVVLGGSSQERGAKAEKRGDSKAGAKTTSQMDEVRSRCIELELGLGWAMRARKDRDKDALAMFQVAQANVLALLGMDARNTGDDSQKGDLEEELTALTGRGRLKWQLGLCLEGARKYGLAEACYKAARADDPTLVDAYVGQVNILRNHLKDADPDSVDRIMNAHLEAGADDRIVPAGDADGLIASLAPVEAVRERATEDTGHTLDVTRLAQDIARRAAEEALAAARLAGRPPEGIEPGRPEAVKRAVRDASRRAARLPRTMPLAEAARIADEAARDAADAAKGARPGEAEVARRIAELARKAADVARKAEDRACKTITARAYLERARYFLANQARLSTDLARELVEAARKPGATAAAVEAARKAAGDAPRRAAIEDAGRARELEPEDAGVLLLSAQLALSGPEPDPKAAREFLEQGRRLHPTNIEMHRLLAGVDQMDRGPRAAIARLWEGIGDLPGDDPGRVELQLGIAELLIQSGTDRDLQEAQKLLNQARNSALGPRIAQPATFYEASIRLAEGKWYQAAKMLEQLAPELAIKPAEGTDGRDRSGLAKRAFLLLGACYEHLNHPGQYNAYRRAADIELPEDGRDNSTLNVQALLGVAQALRGQNKLDEAIAQYQKLLARPGTPPGLRGTIYQNLAWTLVIRNYQAPESRRDWDGVNAALDQARRASQEANNPSGLGAAALLKTQVQLARGQDRDAARDVDAALEAHPKLVELWIAKAAIKQRQGDADGALAVLEAAERELGRPLELLAARARYWAPLLKAGARADAARRALDGLEDEAEALLRRADSAGKPEDATRARDEAGRLVAALIESYTRAGADARARALVERAVRARPDDLDRQVALFEQDLGDPDPEKGLAAAEQLLPRIRRIDDEAEGTGDGAVWRYCQARLRIEQARRALDARQSGASGPLLEEADKLVAEVRRRRPDWPALPPIQGDLDLLQGRPTSALENYQKAIAAGHRGAALIQQTTQLLLQRGRYAEADELLTKLEAPGLAPDGARDLQRMAATAALGAGDYERALAEARRAVAGDSRNIDDLVWLGQILWAASRKADADGRKGEAQGRQLEAEKVLRRAVELDRRRPEPWLVLVQVLASSGQLPRARETVQEAEAQLPLPENALVLAQCYEVTGQDKRAYDLYQRARTAGSEKLASAALRALAQYCLRRGGPTQPGMLSEAQKYLNELMRQAESPADRDWAKHALAVVTGLGGNQRKFLEAIRILGVAPDQDPGSQAASPADRRVQANLLATRPNQGERRRAIGILEDLSKKGLEQPADLFLLAKLYEADKQWPKARAAMEQLLKAYPRNPDYLAYYLAYYVAALLRHDELNDAEVRLMDLEKLVPGQIGLQVRLLRKRNRVPEAVRKLKEFASTDRLHLEPAAGLLEEIGRLEDAEEMYRAIREKFPEYPPAILPLAGFLGRHDRTREALDLLDDRAWARLPVEKASRDSIIILYSAAMDDQALFNEQCDRVAARIEEAIRQYPDKTSLKFDLANLRSIQGRYREAEQIYREVASKDTTTGAALNNLAWLLALEGGRNKAKEALGLVQQAIGTDGETPELLDTRAVAYLALNDADKAIRDLENAIAVTETLDKDFHLARAYLKARRRDEAADRFDKLREGGFRRNSLHPLERALYDELSREFRSE